MFPSLRTSLLILLGFSGYPAAVPAQKPIACDSFSQLEKHIAPFLQSQHTLVINFWATWCGPCVEELPYFDRLNRQYDNEKVKVVLVSLDFKSNYEKRVVPFVQTKGIVSDVLHLTDLDNNTWMPKVHPSWDGALPFTVVIRGERREAFFDKFKDFAELESFVRPFLVAELESKAVFSGGAKK